MTSASPAVTGCSSRAWNSVLVALSMRPTGRSTINSTDARTRRSPRFQPPDRWGRSMFASPPGASRRAVRTKRSGQAADGDALHFDQHSRPGQAGDRDQGAGREIVAEDFAAQLGEAVAQPGVGDEHGHRDHVGQLRPGLFEGAAEAGEDLAHLAVEIADQRAAVGVLDRDLAGQPDRAAARRDHRLRIAARLRRLALQIGALHLFGQPVG